MIAFIEIKTEYLVADLDLKVKDTFGREKEFKGRFKFSSKILPETKNH